MSEDAKPESGHFPVRFALVTLALLVAFLLGLVIWQAVTKSPQSAPEPVAETPTLEPVPAQTLPAEPFPTSFPFPVGAGISVAEFVKAPPRGNFGKNTPATLAPSSKDLLASTTKSSWPQLSARGKKDLEVALELTKDLLPAGAKHRFTSLAPTMFSDEGWTLTQVYTAKGLSPASFSRQVGEVGKNYAADPNSPGLLSWLECVPAHRTAYKTFPFADRLAASSLENYGYKYHTGPQYGDISNDADELFATSWFDGVASPREWGTQLGDTCIVTAPSPSEDYPFLQSMHIVSTTLPISYGIPTKTGNYTPANEEDTVIVLTYSFSKRFE